MCPHTSSMCPTGRHSSPKDSNGPEKNQRMPFKQSTFQHHHYYGCTHTTRGQTEGLIDATRLCYVLTYALRVYPEIDSTKWNADLCEGSVSQTHAHRKYESPNR